MIPKYIKPSEYAKIMDMHVLTVRQHFHAGKIEGIQDPDTGMIKLLNPLYKGQEVSGRKQFFTPEYLQLLIKNH